MGYLFEQFVGLELIYYSRFFEEKIDIYFWRDLNGPEVNWIIAKEEQYIPIEVKWTTEPSLKDAKHLHLFLDEYPNTENAYIICRVPRKTKLANNIYALPWQDIPELFPAI